MNSPHWHGTRAGPVVQRSALTAMLEQVRQTPVTLVRAPAGYAKTATLAAWRDRLAAEGEAVGWLDAGSDTNNPDNAVFLFVDDAHLLSADRLERLVRDAPAGRRLVLASRHALGAPLARLHAGGKLLEVGTDELRFNAEEIAAFVGAEAAPALAARTEGWPAGLSLARQARAGADFSGAWRGVYDYFEQEVVADLSGDVLDCLRGLASLDRFNGALAEAVTGVPDVASRLIACEDRGLFLEPLDQRREWYRFHPLFAEFLRRRIELEDRSRIATTCLAASRWFLRQGESGAAIDYALRGGDPTAAAAILADHCHEFGVSGRQELLEWAERLPPAILDLHPRILMAHAWQMITYWELARARALLERSRRRLDAMREEGSVGADELATLEQMMLHRQILLAQFEDDMPRAERLCLQLIDDYPDAPDDVKGRIYTLLINTRRWQYKFDQLDRLHALAHEHNGRIQNPLLTAIHDSVVGYAHWQTGRAQSALSLLRDAFAMAQARAEPGSLYLTGTALPLAELLYELDERDEAASLIEYFLPPDAQQGLGDQLVSGWLTRARLLAAEGRDAEALDALSAGIAVADGCGFERLRWSAGAEQMRILLGQGKPDEAVRIAYRLGHSRASERVLPAAGVTVRDEARALGHVHLAQAEGRWADGLRIARHWRSFLAAAGAVRARLRWELLVAELLFLSGEANAARRMLREALASAVHGGFRRSFLDAGPVVLGLLRRQRDAISRAQDAPETFLASLFPLSQASGDVTVDPDFEGLGGSFTSQELRILVMAGTGMRNREIGASLGITEGSVKWYLQQIYDKLGVRKRALALKRARQLGLIARFPAL